MSQYRECEIRDAVSWNIYLLLAKETRTKTRSTCRTVSNDIRYYCPSVHVPKSLKKKKRRKRTSNLIKLKKIDIIEKATIVSQIAFGPFVSANRSNLAKNRRYTKYLQTRCLIHIYTFNTLIVIQFVYE